MPFVKVVNIGKTLSDKLTAVGITDVEMLRRTGSWEAFLRIRKTDPTACYSMLCALEGAVQGVRWHHLEEAVKKDLREKLKSVDEECNE